MNLNYLELILTDSQSDCKERKTQVSFVQCKVRDQFKSNPDQTRQLSSNAILQVELQYGTKCRVSQSEKRRKRRGEEGKAVRAEHSRTEQRRAVWQPEEIEKGSCLVYCTVLNDEKLETRIRPSELDYTIRHDTTRHD